MDLPEPDNPPPENPLAPEADEPRPAPHRATLRPPPPPLRIHHVMLLTVVVAVMALVVRAMPDWQQFSPTQQAAWRGFYLIGSMFMAAGLTMTGLGIAWYRRGYRYWDQPGQYIALVFGIWSLTYLGLLVDTIQYGDSYFGYYMLAVSAVLILTLVIDVYAAMRVADSLPWRLDFAIRAIMALTYCVTRWSPWWLVLALMLPLSWAVVRDLRRSVPRHWSHWVGCGLSFANAGVRLTYDTLLLLGFFDPVA